MGLLGEVTPIEHDDHVLRARRTAAITRLVMALAGAALLVARPSLLPHPNLGRVGFATIAITAVVQLVGPQVSWLRVEESLAALAGVLILGFGSERVGVLTILWLVAIASGVLARGGRVHWLGRYIVLVALALPALRYGSLSAEYAAMCVATLGLLLTSGRLTQELNHLLMNARLQAESAETLLMAGDIAARMAERAQAGGPGAGAVSQGAGEPATPGAAVLVSEDAASRAHGGGACLSEGEAASARAALVRLIAGDGLSIVVQPIVDIRSGDVHAYEALARFGQPRADGSPLHWFSLAQELGQRAALERACLRAALALFARKPAGTRLSVNLSAPVLLEAPTLALLEAAGEIDARDLSGLIIEITEETLVHSDTQLLSAIAPLRARGARLAVDDMGAGYSGLRQITSVRPAYLKLDRSLVSGIDADGERAALVGALAGYASQVGSLLVAEGVENEAELRAIRRLGVPLVQGYHLARPGPPWPAVNGADRAAHTAAMALSPAADSTHEAPGVLEPVV
jgi:EAL domain-containing protein (putative c-di-GMP-specific phosphodiesterase class I)